MGNRRGADSVCFQGTLLPGRSLPQAGQTGKTGNGKIAIMEWGNGCPLESKSGVAKVECGWSGFRAQGKIHPVLINTQYDSPFLPVKSELGRSSTFQLGNTRQKKRPHHEYLSCDRPCVFPQDIVAGDMSKKSLWEQKGGSKISSTIKVGRALYDRNKLSNQRWLLLPSPKTSQSQSFLP